ncbi:KICSTOR complex protein kaptin-like isoform X2 [Artemia franciscana]|uniref:Kaptin n=1 Tax=Artemia franciscana TaxID=6661 RepID=A0AA88HS03_ARTSF|nr:hypothetical protein QYM36_007128 [Artemia franciscana]
MASLYANLKELHSLSLPNQSNVYSLAILEEMEQNGGDASDAALSELTNNRAKIVLAALRKPVHLFSFANRENDRNQPFPTDKEIPFTYIPHQAEIIAINGFYRPTDDGVQSSLIIGIAIIKPDESGGTKQYLNMYSEYDITEKDMKLESLALNCFSIELGFIPYQLSHWMLFQGNLQPEMVWLISGSDERLHLFKENRDSHTYEEVDIGPFFPELNRIFPSIVLWVDIMYDQQKHRRLVACGCECGKLLFFVTNVVNDLPNLENEYTEDFSSPITSVKFFETNKAPFPPPAILTQMNINKEVEEPLEASVNVIVTPSGSSSLVFRNVLHNGLTTRQKLPSSENFDVVTCCTVGDVTMDGIDEIILGTYGQVILCYKCNREGGWELLWKKVWSDSVLQLHYCDLTGDGVKELVVLTTNGVQILQHDPETVSQIFSERLANMLKYSQE